jgi:uracil phosphoribosyltransferase
MTIKHNNLIVLQHPVLQHKLTLLRNQNTHPPQFRQVLAEMSRFLAYEVTRDLQTKTVSIDTPLEHMESAPQIDEDFMVVSIMRAGNGMLDAVLDILPFARVGHVGIYRDKGLKSTVEYYFKLPKEPQGKRAIVLDPLLATGDTAVAAIQRLKDYGVAKLDLVCILAAPVGIERMLSQHPDVRIFCISVERELNDKGYILPGLGDAGDRIYGTL